MKACKNVYLHEVRTCGIFRVFVCVCVWRNQNLISRFVFLIFSQTVTIRLHRRKLISHTFVPPTLFVTNDWEWSLQLLFFKFIETGSFHPIIPISQAMRCLKTPLLFPVSHKTVTERNVQRINSWYYVLKSALKPSSLLKNSKKFWFFLAKHRLTPNLQPLELRNVRLCR